MKFISAVECAIWVATVNAASFKTPILAVAADASYNYGRARSVVREEAITRARSNSHQSPSRRERNSRPIRADWEFVRKAGLSNSDGRIVEAQLAIEEDEKVENVPLWDWSEVTYTTQISIGTPPQTFNMLLSISDTDVFVPSASCYHGCQSRKSYNSSHSSTYSSHDDEMTLYQLRMHTMSHLAQDDFQIGGLSIKGQMFGEANGIVDHAATWGKWDGMLGLAPSNFESELELLNPFQEMISQGLLDRNLFSLRLPRGDDAGELLFGDVNDDLYVGTLKSLPIVSRSEDMPRLKGRWIVPANSMKIGAGYVALDGFVAALETDFPLIALPEDYVTLINRYLGMSKERAGDEPPSIDCKKRHALGNLTISLGKHDFTISPWDYTIEMDMSVWREGQVSKRCVSAFYSLPNYIDEKYIVLGGAFMRAFYGVFDLDERSVSLAPVKTRHGESNAPKEKVWQQELRRRR